jgi:hypothetical protein
MAHMAQGMAPSTVARPNNTAQISAAVVSVLSWFWSCLVLELSGFGAADDHIVRLKDMGYSLVVGTGAGVEDWIWEGRASTNVYGCV